MGTNKSSASAPSPQDRKILQSPAPVHHCDFLDGNPLGKAKLLNLSLEGLSAMSGHSQLDPDHFDEVIALSVELWADVGRLTERLAEAEGGAR